MAEPVVFTINISWPNVEHMAAESHSGLETARSWQCRHRMQGASKFNRRVSFMLSDSLADCADTLLPSASFHAIFIA